MDCDAIVNAANSSLLGGGGVNGAIHAAAGPMLLAECTSLNGCETGQAKITGGYNLFAKFVIHAVGPKWDGGKNNEAELLSSAYQNALILADKYKCRSIAFPAISSGIYNYPKTKATQNAIQSAKAYLDRKISDIEKNIFCMLRC